MPRTSIFLSLKDIQYIRECSKTAANSELQNIRTILNKPKKAPITIRDYARANNIDENEVRINLGMKPVNYES